MAHRVQAIITYQSMLKECVVKVVNENGDDNCSQDNLRLERTRSNTPINRWDQKSFDVLTMPRETDSKLKTCNFDPNSIRQDEDLQGQAVHVKNWQKHRFIAKELM